MFKEGIDPRNRRWAVYYKNEDIGKKKFNK
jgi:hypothetical protein